MNQSMTTQFDKLKEKSHHIANIIAGSSVDRRQAFLTYHAVYVPSISYVLLLMHFTKSECHKISSTPMRQFLQKCGFASTTRREIVFASRQSGGLGFRNLYFDQGIAHIIKFIQVLRTPGQPSILLRISLCWWQALCGAAYPLLEFPLRPCLYQEGQWLQSTRRFLADINGSIKTSFSYHYSPLLTNDQSIMDAFSNSG